MISLLIVIIIVLILVIWLIYNNNNIKNDINKLESEYNTNLYDEYELDDPDDEIEHFNKEDEQIKISKEDYEKIRNDEFNNQFFNFKYRINNSSDNVDNSVDRINRYRNCKFGFTEDDSIGMKIRDISNYFISK